MGNGGGKVQSDYKPQGPLRQSAKGLLSRPQAVSGQNTHIMLVC